MEDITYTNNDPQVNDARNNTYTGNNQSVHADLMTHGTSTQPLGSYRQQGNIFTDSTNNNTSLDSSYYHDNDNDQSHGATTIQPVDSNISMVFKNFISSKLDPFVIIAGDFRTLESLQNSLLSGILAQRFGMSADFSPFTPLTISLNVVCAELEFSLITERDLYRFTLEPWFVVLTELYIETYHIKETLSINQLRAGFGLDVHSNYLLVKAFQTSRNLPSVDLGIVAVCDDATISAFRFRCESDRHGPTAWMISQRTPDSIVVFHGIGFSPLKQAKAVVLEDEREEDSTITFPNTASTPRKTSTRVQALQVPLDIGLSADDILRDHPKRIYYNNVLKVALTKSNNEIFKAIEKHKQPSRKKSTELNGASGVVKRINTGLEFLEKKFGIASGALRTAFDGARKANEVNVRPKEEVDDAILNANGPLIDAVMNWIQQGGPMPAALNVAASNAAESTTAPIAVAPAVALGPVFGTAPISQRYPLATRPIPPQSDAPVDYAGHASGEPTDLLDFLPDPDYSNSNQMDMGGDSGGPNFPSPDDAPASVVPLDHQDSTMATNDDNGGTQVADNYIFGFSDGTRNRNLPRRNAFLSHLTSGPNGTFDYDDFNEKIEWMKNQ